MLLKLGGLVPDHARSASWRSWCAAADAALGGDQAYAVGDWKTAVEAYGTALTYLASTPDDRGLRAHASSRRSLAEAELLLVNQSFEAARAAFRAAGDGAEAKAGLQRVRIAELRQEGEQLLAQGLAEPARERYQEILRLAPRDADAERELQRIEERWGQRFQAEIARLGEDAERALQGGQYEVAARLLEELDEKAPDDAVRGKLDRARRLRDAAAALGQGGCDRVQVLLQGLADPAAERMLGECARSVRLRRSAVASGMVPIPAGSFEMGDKGLDDMRPRHKVSLEAFLIDKYKVTNRQYAEFCTATGRKPPAYWRGGEVPPGLARHPVRGLTWDDAASYCKWVGKRLPTEAEWERAARGPKGHDYPWGNSYARNKYNSAGQTTPVDAYDTFASGFGVVAMIDYVWEWTGSWFEPYPGNNKPDPRYGGHLRAVRGRLKTKGDGVLSVASRHALAPDEVDEHLGVRCAIGAAELQRLPE